MSESNKTSKSKSKSTTGLIAALCICIGLIGGGIGGYFAGSSTKTPPKLSESQTENSSTADDSSVDKTKELESHYHKVESIDEAKAKVKEVNGVFDELLKKNVYFNVQIGQDSYDGYLYNTKGEIVSQSSDGSLTTVYTKDKHCVAVSSEDQSMTVDASIDFVAMCRNALNAVSEDNKDVTLYMVDSEGEDSSSDEFSTLGKVQEYVIDFKGEDACKLIYSSTKADYADTVIKALKEYLGDSWVPHMEIGFVWSEDNQLASYCNIISESGSHDSNWICIGSGDTPDWELPEEWYSADYTTNTDENNAKLMDMLNNFTEYLSKILYPNGNPNDPNSSNESEADNQSSAVDSDESNDSSE